MLWYFLDNIRIFFCVLRPAVGKSVRQADCRASGRRGVLHLQSPLQKRRENLNPHLSRAAVTPHSRRWSPLPPLLGHKFIGLFPTTRVRSLPTHAARGPVGIAPIEIQIKLWGKWRRNRGRAKSDGIDD